MAFRFIHLVFLLGITPGWGTRSDGVVAGAFIAEADNPDIRSMRQFSEGFTNPLPTQLTSSTDHMKSAEKCYIIQGAHLSQGGTQTVGMTGSTSKAAEIAQNICSDWNFDAAGTFYNDHIGPVRHHHQQYQPHELFLEAEEVCLPVNQEEPEEGSQKRARQHNEFSLSGPPEVSKKMKTPQEEIYIDLVGCIDQPNKIQLPSHPSKIIPENLQNYEPDSAPSATWARLLPDHLSNCVPRKTPQQATFNSLSYNKIYMDLLGCLNEPDTIPLSNHPRKSTPEILQNTLPSSDPAPFGARVLDDHSLDSVLTSQLIAQSGKQIPEEINQEEVQGGISNKNTPTHFSVSKSKNSIVQSQRTQGNIDVTPLAYHSQTQLTDTTKEPNPSCEDTLKRKPNHMDALYSRPTQIETYYSGHALSWNPEEICKKASIFTETLADKLLDSITCIEIKERLEQMHQSHAILIPFTYDLALKNLTVSHWYKIEKTWACIWQSFSKHHPPISDENILRTFVWVADYISEITSFKEFSHYLDPQVKKHDLPHLQMFLIRHLSMPSTRVYRLKDPYFSYACNTVVTYFLNEGPSSKFKELTRCTMRELHTEVLVKLHQTSQKIVSACPTRLKGSSVFNMLTKKALSKFNPTSLLTALFQVLLVIDLDKKNGGGNVISQLPITDERFFQDIIDEDSSSKVYSGYSSKNLQKDVPLIEVLQSMRFFAVQPEQKNLEEFKFLPSKIRDHLNRYLS
ncbi:hypothetical protein MJO28_016443 [Puccinia striiformis f. sp. tritici]|uniref:Uncharacterized protein n=1 Tax=Puccinia striiformis f. sp. tritici TaxID=168172 RepID=A0ACC0DN58_9BASI|nr:hypothetical protein MJO28_016443 [Puccinia striiformis f. sp. tritici]